MEPDHNWQPVPFENWTQDLFAGLPVEDWTQDAIQIRPTPVETWMPFSPRHSMSVSNQQETHLSLLCNTSSQQSANIQLHAEEHSSQLSIDEFEAIEKAISDELQDILSAVVPSALDEKVSSSMSAALDVNENTSSSCNAEVDDAEVYDGDESSESSEDCPLSLEPESDTDRDKSLDSPMRTRCLKTGTDSFNNNKLISCQNQDLLCRPSQTNGTDKWSMVVEWLANIQNINNACFGRKSKQHSAADSQIEPHSRTQPESNDKCDNMLKETQSDHPSLHKFQFSNDKTPRSQSPIQQHAATSDCNHQSDAAQFISKLPRSQNPGKQRAATSDFSISPHSQSPIQQHAATDDCNHYQSDDAQVISKSNQTHTCGQRDPCKGQSSHKELPCLQCSLEQYATSSDCHSDDTKVAHHSADSKSCGKFCCIRQKCKKRPKKKKEKDDVDTLKAAASPSRARNWQVRNISERCSLFQYKKVLLNQCVPVHRTSATQQVSLLSYVLCGMVYNII